MYILFSLAKKYPFDPNPSTPISTKKYFQIFLQYKWTQFCYNSTIRFGFYDQFKNIKKLIQSVTWVDKMCPFGRKQMK